MKDPKQSGKLQGKIEALEAELERRDQLASQAPQANTSKAWLAQVRLTACSGPIDCHRLDVVRVQRARQHTRVR